ncbi:hypothetical protein TNCV_2996101 [Trichonephila clavipes]|nr:hypothetical protein TNCV_2996101 [Trichonephila clavipes]
MAASSSSVIPTPYIAPPSESLEEQELEPTSRQIERSYEFDNLTTRLPRPLNAKKRDPLGIVLAVLKLEQ